MKTRNGKIARLPQYHREEVNRRIQNEETAETILGWLNEQETCKEIMNELFDGQPVSKHNLSEWRQGGYVDWLRNEEIVARVKILAEDEYRIERKGQCLADRLATVLEVELTEEVEQLDTITDPGERWKRTQEILEEVHRLRREDHHARKVRMIEEKREIERRQAAEEAEREEKEKIVKDLEEAFYSAHNLPLDAQLLGGGKYGWKCADWLRRVRFGLPMPDWWKKNPKFEFPTDPQCEMGGEKNQGSEVAHGQTSAENIRSDEKNGG